MAGSKRPSFLKRQKEQARLARAAEKREARRARKHAKSLGVPSDASDEEPTAMEQEGDLPADEEPAGDEA